MNYDLLKRLKDAGYPQRHRDGHAIVVLLGCEQVAYTYCYENDIKIVEPSVIVFSGAAGVFYKQPKPREDTLYIPGLSELIYACGKDGFSLSFVDDKIHNPMWFAGKEPLVLGVPGFSPTEAVANLWLKLNEK